MRSVCPHFVDYCDQFRFSRIFSANRRRGGGECCSVTVFIEGTDVQLSGKNLAFSVLIMNCFYTILFINNKSVETRPKKSK